MSRKFSYSYPAIFAVYPRISLQYIPLKEPFRTSKPLRANSAEGRRPRTGPEEIA